MILSSHLDKSKEHFVRFFCRFVDSKFVKTYDELVIRSPFKSIANCVAKAFQWNASGDSVSPAKNLEDAKKNDESIRSRSGWL